MAYIPLAATMHNAQYTPPTPTRLKVSSWVASAVCTQFATSWRQSRRVWRNLTTVKSSCVVSALWTHPSAVLTQFTANCAVELLTLVTSDDTMTSLLKKVINIDQNSRSQTKSVSKLSTESVGSRRELVANCVNTVYKARRSCIVPGFGAHIRVWWPQSSSRSSARSRRRARFRTCRCSSCRDQWGLRQLLWTRLHQWLYTDQPRSETSNTPRSTSVSESFLCIPWYKQNYNLHTSHSIAAEHLYLIVLPVSTDGSVV